MWPLRFGLVRVRENAESIAFYGGEASEANLLFQRLGNVIANYGNLLVTSRNLSFFTSFYRCCLLLQFCMTVVAKCTASVLTAVIDNTLLHAQVPDTDTACGCGGAPVLQGTD